ncbi:MAG: hypothetical protein ACLP1X_00090, partial [Polyangiaceae bacterium]
MRSRARGMLDDVLRRAGPPPPAGHLDPRMTAGATCWVGIVGALLLVACASNSGGQSGSSPPGPGAGGAPCGTDGDCASGACSVDWTLDSAGTCNPQAIGARCAKDAD